MDIFTILVWILFGMIGLAVYQIFIKKKKYGTILVSFSEVVGDRVIEHSKTYVGQLHYKKDILKIPKLNLLRPLPPTDVIIPTNDGKKKVYLIKIDISRYAYRIPNLNNQIFTFKRDDNGNIVKMKGKPQLKKFKWRFADNVIEQEDIHWMDHLRKEIKAKHDAKENALMKWAGPLSLVVIFLFAIIAMNMLTKQWQVTKDAIFEKAEAAEARAESTANMLNKILEKTTGTRILNTEETEREKYINETTS